MITIDELAKIPLFSTLGAKELKYLQNSVEDIRLIPGEYAAREGDSRFLAVVVEGKTELTKIVHGVERIIATRLPGELGGEVPMMLSTPLPANMRAAEPSRILKLSVKVFYTLAAMAPQISATVGAAALQRMEMLRNAAAQPLPPAMIVIGPQMEPEVHAIQSFLNRNQIPFDSVAPDGTRGPFPVVQLPDGTRFVRPSMHDVASAAGLKVAPSQSRYDLVIVGGGPAGMTAAVNAAAEGLRTVLIERYAPGGQAGTSSRIENYLGFPFGVSGDDLASRALQQAKRLGAEIVVTRRVEAIDPSTLDVTLDSGEILGTKAIILAMGVDWRRIAIRYIDHFIGRGVYYGAARSDAGLTQGQQVFLIGAGNSAGQAAINFSSYASSVTLIARAESLTQSMSQYLIEQIATKANIHVQTQSEVVGLHGGDHLEAIDVLDRRTGSITRREAVALFVMIGADAVTDWLPAEIERDSHGYVLTGADLSEATRYRYREREREQFMLETSVPGIFAVGDVRSGSVKRVAAGVGEGGMAIAFVHKRLQHESLRATG